MSIFRNQHKGGRDGMKKPSIGLQDLRRRIYVKAKTVSAGNGGTGRELCSGPAARPARQVT